MKTAAALALLATLGAAAPAKRAESLDLSKRLDGPVTVNLHHASGAFKGDLVESQKLHLAWKYPQFFDAEDLERLHKRADNTQVSVYGPDISWTAPTDIGTPAQTLELLVDTGSGALWAFSSKCAHCGTGTFDSSKSSTFQDTQQPVRYAYGTGQTYIKGNTVKDTVGIGSIKSEGVEFALIDEQVAMRLQNTSAGLSGWSWPSKDDNGTESDPVPYVQATQKQWSEPTFGLFLNRKNPRAEQAGVASKGDGAITVSGVDNKYFDGELTWTERKVLSDRFNFAWGVDFEGITVNGKKHDLAPGTGAVLDSGTSLIFGPLEAVTQYYQDVEGAENNGDGTWKVPCDNFNNKVSFHIAGQAWDIEATDLIFDDEQRGGCIGSIAVNPGLRGGEHWLVGAAFMKNVYTAHRYDPPGVGLAKLKQGI